MTQPTTVHYHQFVRPPTNGLAVASLVTGILGAIPGVLVIVPILGLFMAFLAVVPAVLAVIFGHIGLTTAKRMSGLGHGNALAGLILGYVVLGLIAATTLFWIVAMVASSTSSGTA